MNVHPIRKGRTLLNAFLFNLRLLLLCAPAIVHFQTEIFAKYMIHSTSVELFVKDVRRMDLLEFLFSKNVFYYIFLIFSGLSFLYLMCKPNSERLNIEKMIKERKQRSF